MADAPHALRAAHLRKEFTIHVHQATTLKEVVVKKLFTPGERRPLVALDDLSFTLEAGRSLAIVGSNGSGKSTLLKLISGITKPSAGTLEVNGRIAALLELGAGFEFEFTGMENIFLQCQIYGLTRAQILERLESILDFAELDQFIHTPVKRYSSGMRVRLGFAIAAHVDADILLFDEVLTVGDAAFQVKCLRKARELHEQGRTILFVSHLLEHVEAMADLVLWLDKGRAVAFGPADEVLPKFYEAIQGRNEGSTSEVAIDARAAAALPAGRSTARKARLRRLQVLDAAGAECRQFHVADSIRLRAEIEAMEPLELLEFSFALGTMDALRATWNGSGTLLRDVAKGVYTMEGTIERTHLAPGRYLLSVMLGDPRDITVVYDLHLRLYAIALHDDERSTIHDTTGSRLLPFGAFQPGGGGAVAD